MKRTVILFAAIAVSIVLSSYCHAQEKRVREGVLNDTANRQQSWEPASKPKYPLRKEPMRVSDNEAQSKFKLNDDWRPLEYIQNDFKDNGDGTITDNATGLMWQKSGSDKLLVYKDAEAYIDELNRRKFAGYGDWRLPTVDELKSLITKEKQSNDLYISPIFEKKNYNWFWSSDKRASGGVWNVHFSYGDVNWRSGSNLCVRAVRSLTP